MLITMTASAFPFIILFDHSIDISATSLLKSKDSAFSFLEILQTFGNFPRFGV